MNSNDRREALRDRYEKWWSFSNAREKKIKELLEERLGTEVVPYGLGAMSDKRITGSARDNGFEPADPDLYIKKYDSFVEVTGPLKPFIHPKDALFVNPDKIENARRKSKKGKSVWLVHVLDRKGVREQILSLGNLLPADIRKELSQYCLTDHARCKLGKLYDLMEKGRVTKQEVVTKVVRYYKKGILYRAGCRETSIVRCFRMDEEFAARFNEATVRFGGESFVQIPSDYEGIKTLSEMVSDIKEGK